MANAWLLKPLPVAGAVTTSGTLQAGAGENVFNDYAGVICQLTCNAAGNTASLRFDLGADRAIDSLMIFGLELLPPAATVELAYATAAQGYFTGASSSVSAPAYAGSVVPASGKGVSVVSLAAPATARFIRITFSAGSPGQAVRVSRIGLGQRIQLQRNFSYGATAGVRDLGKVDFSARGVLLRQRGRKLRTIGLTFSHIRKDEVEASIQPLLEQVGNTEPIALLTDPAEDAQRQNRAYFGPLVGDLGTVRRNAAAYEAKTNLVSIF